MWVNPQDRAFWPIATLRPSDYAVELTYSCKCGDGGCEVVVELGGQKIQATTFITPNWLVFRSDHLLGMGWQQRAGDPYGILARRHCL